MASTKTGKYGAYQEIFNKVDPSRQTVAAKYIAELKFMETQLRKLKRALWTNFSRENSPCCGKVRP